MLALGLGLALLAACAAWAYRALEVTLPADRILSSINLGGGLGKALARQLAAFAGALLIVHLTLGLLAFGCARLTAAGSLRIGAKGQRWLVVGWFAMLTVLIFAANTTWFPASNFSGSGGWWREYRLGLYPVEWLAALTLVLLTLVAAQALRRSPPGSRRLGLVAGLGSLVAIAFLLLARGPAAAASDAVESRPNIVIIGIDSLRSDLSLPRGGEAAMPGVKAFLAGACRLTDATTPLARTFGSWVSILTGRHPVATGARVNLMPRTLVKAEDNLGTALRAAGYHTVFATDESRFANIDASYGFDRVITPPIGVRDMLLVQAGDMPLVNLFTATPAGGWLFPSNYANRASFVNYRPSAFVGRLERELESEEPAFVAIHLTLAHWPYSWAGHEKPGTPDAYRTAYRRALEAVDSQFTEVMQLLERRGILRNALVVLLSDHGEALGGDDDTMLRKTGTPLEIWRSIWGHGTSVLSPHQFTVLLAMRPFGRAKFPGSPGPRDIPVSLEDLRPTLQQYATGEVTGDVDGMSLLPYLANPDLDATLASRIRFTETDFNTANTLAGNFRAAAIVNEAAEYYELDRKTGWVQFRPSRLQDLLAQKQRAAVGLSALLAAEPGPPGGPPVRYLYASREDPVPRPFDATQGPGEDLEARRLWEALQRRYAGELSRPADTP